ncbi:MAG: pyridoxamine 5'-phosphate oxidase family protein [Clostridiales bacterium]|nr:pyridoxamine 5'-phosphate oxidase family protein [Clostridiales bacterium]
MTKQDILDFIKKQKTAFIGSVDENGYPVIRAMLAPRVIDGNDIYFSTNTSSKKVAQYLANNKACVYFYKRGRFKYHGATLIGDMEVCQDQPTKNMIWRFGDSLFYKKGVTDPDYSVLKFTCRSAEYYCDLKIETVLFD